MKNVVILQSLVVAVLMATPAHAWMTGGPTPTFSMNCTFDGSFTYVPVNIDTINTNMTQKNYNPKQLNDLNNNLNYEFALNANNATTQANLFFLNFGLEQNFDFLTVSNVLQVDANNNKFTAPLGMTGYLTHPVVPVSQPSAGGMQATPSFLFLQTNFMNPVPSIGFTINQIALKSDCNTIAGGMPPMPQPLLTDGTVYIGVLGAPGDTIYYTLPAESQRSDAHDGVVAMWREPDTDGIDFDLYAKCNSLPTPSSWDVSSHYGATQYNSTEFLYLQESKCKNGTWFIAANSYSGRLPNAGSYYLQANYVNDHRPHIFVGSQLLRSQLSAAWTEIYLAVREFFGASEMSSAITAFDFYQQADPVPVVSPPPIQVWFDPYCTRAHNIWEIGSSPPPNAGVETSTVYLCNASGNGCLNNPICGAHELGHWEFGLSDEYQDVSGSPSYRKCGHSIMADTHTSWMHDWCIGSYTEQYVGGVVDHLVDAPAAEAGSAGGSINPPAAWPTVNGHGNRYRPKFTPIGYNFANHPLRYTTSDNVTHDFIVGTLHAYGAGS